VPAGITGRLEALVDDRTWGAGILLEQFGDQALERVQLAGAGTVGPARAPGPGDTFSPCGRPGGDGERSAASTSARHWQADEFR